MTLKDCYITSEMYFTDLMLDKVITMTVLSTCKRLSLNNFYFWYT